MKLNKLGKMKGTLMVGVLIALALISFNAQASENQPDERDVGYEFLDGGAVLHIWNVNDDYYFDTDSGIQMTNHYEEYWTKNVFCIGYKTSQWNYKCSDELNNFTWSIDTDNSTYVEILGHRNTTVQNYDVKFGLKYYLELDDTDLTVEPSITNLDQDDINVDVGFAWHTKDIQIAGYEDNNFVNVAWSYNHNLSEDLEEYYSNLGIGEYVIEREGEWLRLRWDNNLDYGLKIESNANQANAPITLGINAGTLASGQTKSTELYWIDATCGGVFGEESVIRASGRAPLNLSDPYLFPPFDVVDGTADYLRFGDNITIEKLTCYQNGFTCPVPPIEGICATQSQQGFLECNIQIRHSPDVPVGSQQTNDSWGNDVSWTTGVGSNKVYNNQTEVYSSPDGFHCDEQNGTHYAEITNYTLTHNNFTDVRCNVRTKTWNDPGFPVSPYCSKSYKGSAKLDNWWANNNTPSAENVTITIVNDTHLNFDGNDDYVETNNATILSNLLSSDFSISAWAKITGNATDNIVISQTNGSGIGRNWIMLNPSSCSNSIGSFIGGQATCSGVVPDLDTWYHVLVTYGGNDLSIYVNNTLLANSSVVADENASGDIRFGINKNLGQDFNGSLDEVRFYNRSVSLLEISEIYERGRIFDPDLASDGLISYFSLDEGFGDTTYDSSTNNYSAFLNGTTWVDWGWNSNGELGLMCSYDFLDLDGDIDDTDLAIYNWTKNGIDQGINYWFVNWENTSYGENWTCSATVFDDVFATGSEKANFSNSVQIVGRFVNNETLARQAIEEGINNAITPNLVLTDQLVYTRDSNNTQNPSSYFDKVAFLNNQRWSFNYFTGYESETTHSSLGTTSNFWQNSSLTYEQIVNQVETLINDTKV